MFTGSITVWPNYFTEGQYNVRAYTYGYIQDQDFTAYTMNGQVADMAVNVLIGVNVTLDVLFKKETSSIFEVDLNGLVSGNALAFTWSNEFRPLSWASVNVVGASGASFNFYTYDGIYEAYLTPGTYKFTISSPGYTAQTFSAAVSPDQFGVGQNAYLQQSNIPVPEFSGVAVVAFSALAASLYLLRRRRK